MSELQGWTRLAVVMDATAEPGALWPYSTVPKPWHADEDSAAREGRYLVHRWMVSTAYHRLSTDHYLLRVAKNSVPYWPWHNGFWVLVAANGRIMGRWTCHWVGKAPPQMAKPPLEWAQKQIVKEV